MKYSLLAVFLASCAARLPSPQEIPAPAPLPLEQRRNDEPLHAFGKRVCSAKGEGVHPFIPDEQGKEIYQVRCEEHGGIEIIEIQTLRHGQFDYPEPRLLSLEELIAYASNKIVTLFGGGHGEDNVDDAERFIRYIPSIK